MACLLTECSPNTNLVKFSHRVLVQLVHIQGDVELSL